MWPNVYVTFNYINEQGSYMDSVKQLKLKKTFDVSIRGSFSQRALLSEWLILK